MQVEALRENVLAPTMNRVDTLVSVNVGLPKDVPWHGETVHTGIWKQPVSGPRMVRRLNIDGDGQGDLGGHGGEHRAVLVYQLDAYAYWRDVLGRSDLEYGQFGENFTVEGLGDDEVCIGDRLQIGEALFEVTQPRVTCYRLGMRMDEPQMAALLVGHHRPGFYVRVLTEGRVAPGAERRVAALLSGPAGPAGATGGRMAGLPAVPCHPGAVRDRRRPLVLSGGRDVDACTWSIPDPAGARRHR